MKNILQDICEFKEYPFTSRFVKPILVQSYAIIKPKSNLFLVYCRVLVTRVYKGMS